MEEIYRERRPLVARLLEDRPLCEIGRELWREPGAPRCQGRASEVHEKLSRARGGSILDASNCVTACHACHHWVTTHPARAKELGWLETAPPKGAA